MNGHWFPKKNVSISAKQLDNYNLLNLHNQIQFQIQKNYLSKEPFRINSGLKQMVLAIGGPYGFSEAVYKSAHGKISFSKMTFPNQIIRLFLCHL